METNEQIIKQLKISKSWKPQDFHAIRKKAEYFFTRCDNLFREYHYSPFFFTMDIISDNFLSLLVGEMTFSNLTKSASMFSIAYNTIAVICRHYPERIVKLEGMDICSRVLQIIDAEKACKTKLKCQGQDGHVAKMAHLISEFLPPMEISSCHNDLNEIEVGIAYNGRNRTKKESSEVKNVVERLFPTLMRLCISEESDITHLILIYKMVYWADKYNTLEKFSTFVLTLAKTLIFKKDKKMLIGFALLLVLQEKHIKEFQSEKLHLFTDQLKADMLSFFACGIYPWIENLYAIKTTYWLHPTVIEPYVIRKAELQSGIHLVESIFRDLFPHGNLMIRLDDAYQKLIKFVLDILNDKEESRDQEADISPTGKKNFEVMVAKVVNALDAIQIDKVYIHFVQDTKSLAQAFYTHKNVRLGLFDSSHFDKVLGSSQSPREIETNPLMKALRILSILHEVSENWSVLFGKLSGERIVDRSCFTSQIFERVLENILVGIMQGHPVVPLSVEKMVDNYPFLFSYGLREKYFRFRARHILSGLPREKRDIILPRKGLFDAMVKDIKCLRLYSQSIWAFQFKDELGIGQGPTKEFYTEFSHDCLRHQLRLWHGEPIHRSDSIKFTSSTCGLFPLPSDVRNTASTDDELFCIGIVIGKSLVEGHLMDIHFSTAFYKLLFGINPQYQQLFLSDLKDVLPVAFSFVESLMQPLNLKVAIERNTFLTAERKRLELDAITVDGCTFEDLCVNFTVPGLVPEVELMKYGKDIYLNIHNLDEYLRLLVFKVLYSGQRRNFEALRSGLKLILPGTIMSMFMADEMGRLLCGVKTGKWSVDYLMKNCRMSEELPIESPAVRFLFGVLSELTENEQSLFVRFTTSMPSLPYGGLGSLDPKLTIARKVPPGGDHDACLPSASTCYNTLFIADYSSKEILRKKLLLAISEGNDSFHFY